jgi:type I restriction enzyme S subunit
MAGLAQVAFFQNGRPFPSSEYVPTGVKLLRPGNLFADGSVRWTAKNMQCLPETLAQSNPDHVIRANELVMNLTAQSLKDEFLGRTCLTASDERCLLNQRLARIDTVSGIDRRFALFLLKGSRFRRFVDGLNTGSLIQHMFTSQLDEFVFPLPPAAEQVEIVAEVDRRLSVADAAEMQVEHALQRAARLRQAILKRAFEGKLVEQDPTDEPAAALLARIKPATNGRHPAAAKPPMRRSRARV